MIVLNLKKYKNKEEISSFLDGLEKIDKKFIVCVPLDYLDYCKRKNKVKIFTQYLDFSHTNVDGTLLNHSDYRIGYSKIKKSLDFANKKGLKVILCVKDLEEARKFSKLDPWAIAFESPELIGSGKSITKYKSEDVRNFAKMLKGKKVIPLCGAGISDEKDVKEAYRLGCKGVLIASAIAKPKNPWKLVKRIIRI